MLFGEEDLRQGKPELERQTEAKARQDNHPPFVMGAFGKWSLCHIQVLEILEVAIGLSQL